MAKLGDIWKLAFERFFVGSELSLAAAPSLTEESSLRVAEGPQRSDGRRDGPQEEALREIAEALLETSLVQAAMETLSSSR